MRLVKPLDMLRSTAFQILQILKTLTLLLE